jgi:guanyl-specific ribonuclease Sa
MKPNSGMYSGTGDIWTTSIPQKVYDLYNHILDNNGSPPRGIKGGRKYNNEPNNGEAKLPKGVTYKEYDVNPRVKGKGRDSERLVIDENNIGYYTDTHYKSFKKLDNDKKGE